MKKMKVINTGMIAYLKYRKFPYTTQQVLIDGRKVIDFYFEIPGEEENIMDEYNSSEFILFKRELDATKHEIDFLKNN